MESDLLSSTSHFRNCISWVLSGDTVPAGKGQVGEAAVPLDGIAAGTCPTHTEEHSRRESGEGMPSQTRANKSQWSFEAVAALPQRWRGSGSQPEVTLQKPR